jgi:hypothetical protein
VLLLSLRCNGALVDETAMRWKKHWYRQGGHSFF